MPFVWREYLELALNLRNFVGPLFSSEASNRSAVSRAYYAAFCVARNFAESNLCYQRTGRPEDHKTLTECLIKRGGRYQRIAYKLKEIRIWRNKCDYDDEVQNLGLMTDKAIAYAQDILDACQ